MSLARLASVSSVSSHITFCNFSPCSGCIFPGIYFITRHLLNVKGISFGKFLRVQELCESRGGRPGLSVLMSLTVSVDVKLH